MRFAVAPLIALLCAWTCAPPSRARAATESEPLVVSVCRLIDSSARAQDLPVSFLTRLIWQESNFRSDVVSPAGAAGVAQFMPATAAGRGLADPLDPEAAIPKAAALLAELRKQFGNLGLAAAAYNAGPARVSAWLAGTGGLPYETRYYVAAVTHHNVEEWVGSESAKLTDEAVFPDSSCVQQVALVARGGQIPTVAGGAAPQMRVSPLFAPWGVQIAGGFSKAAALRVYAHARAEYASVLGSLDPIVIGGLLRSRGSRAFYRVRAPAQTRAEAEALCNKLLRVGGACVVLRS